jgi:pimeloyl-ACP methyl ester carboxylesterase
MFGTPENWRSAMNALADVCDVHAPLLPIFHTPERRDPVEFLVEVVRDYMKSRGITQAILVGNSLGGHVAMRLALLEPEQVVALVLSGSSGLFERGMEKNVPRRPTREWLRQRTAQVFFDASRVTDEMLDDVESVVFDRRSALQLLRVGRSAKGDNLAPLLPQLLTPTLIIWGENDQITPLSTAWEFYELLPNSSLETIPCCGHAPMMEQPARFNELLLNFVETKASSRKVLPIPQRAEKKQSQPHAGQNDQVPAEVREAAAA